MINGEELLWGLLCFQSLGLPYGLSSFITAMWAFREKYTTLLRESFQSDKSNSPWYSLVSVGILAPDIWEEISFCFLVKTKNKLPLTKTNLSQCKERILKWIFMRSWCIRMLCTFCEILWCSWIQLVLQLYNFPNLQIWPFPDWKLKERIPTNNQTKIQKAPKDKI